MGTHLRTHRTAVLCCIGLLVVGLVVTGCGGGKKGGGPTGPTAEAPMVSNLQVHPLDPEVSGKQVRYAITATVVDADNDLVGGRAEARVPATGETKSFTIEASDLSGNTLGALLVTNPLPPGRYDFTFSVIDAAGHRSNEVPFSITIRAAELPRGTVPVPTPGTFLDQLRPAK